MSWILRVQEANNLPKSA